MSLSSILVLLVAGGVFIYILPSLLVLLRNQTSGIERIATATGLPRRKSLGGGWFEVTCSECKHTFTWFDEDNYACTRCNKSYPQELSFEPPPDEWEPL